MGAESSSDPTFKKKKKKQAVFLALRAYVQAFGSSRPSWTHAMSWTSFCIVNRTPGRRTLLSVMSEKKSPSAGVWSGVVQTKWEVPRADGSLSRA